LVGCAVVDEVLRSFWETLVVCVISILLSVSRTSAYSLWWRTVMLAQLLIITVMRFYSCMGVQISHINNIWFGWH